MTQRKERIYIRNYKVQTLQKIKIWSASNWNWSWLYTKVTNRLFPFPSPPLQDLAFALPLVAILVVVVIIFIVSACIVYRARYGYFCCWKPVSLSSQFASQERNTYVPHAVGRSIFRIWTHGAVASFPGLGTRLMLLCILYLSMCTSMVVTKLYMWLLAVLKVVDNPNNQKGWKYR